MKNNDFKKKEKDITQLSTEDILVISSLITIVAVIAICGVVYVVNNALGLPQIRNCASKVYFGIPCPGCGATRSLFSLLRFDLSAALRYNSFVVYFAFVYIIFVVSHILKYITRGKIKGIKYRHIYVVLAIVVAVVQYVLKLTVPFFSV